MKEPTTILVVDDEDAARFVKAQILRRAGFKVLEAATGGTALQISETTPVDVVVLDVHLPDIHGFDVCRRLKEQTAPGVQVLQISSTAITDADQVRGLQAGADVYLTEPVGPDVLVATVRSLLRIRRSELALADALEREQRARKEAEEANRLKDDFLAALSHELRTPLNAIMGWVWQLDRDGLAPSTRARALESLKRNTRIQAQLINDLLDVARISKGKLQLDLRPYDLKKIVEAAVETAREAASRKNTRLELEAQSTMIIGDASRLNQVISNLLSNAIQFTPEGGRVSVSVAVEDDTAVVQVRDNGIGIEPEFLPSVFDRFRQAQGGLSRKHGGLGLGLAIVRQLVELHGGQVSAESPGAGQGSTFSVRLRRASAHERAATNTIEPLLRNVNVLIVNDDEEVRELLAATLEASGARATTASSTERAADLLDDQVFDVLVSDIRQPESDGVELLATARARGHLMPAVAVTALTGADDRARILASGYGACVPKPIRSAELVRVIVELLQGASLNAPSSPSSGLREPGTGAER